jgi:hypothetical protein
VETIHQEIEALNGGLGLMMGEMRVTCGGENRLMTEKLL